MKLTPEKIKQRNAARRVRATPITDPAERARRQAAYAEARRLDDGTTMVVEDALCAVAEGASRGRNLLNVVAQLITHLTPEQQLGLAERLPGLLPREALESFARQATVGLSTGQPDAARSEAG